MAGSAVSDDRRTCKSPCVARLEGAGSWTHQYADPANTANSGDSLLQGQLGMLWFRDVDFNVPSRHGRAPAPSCISGGSFTKVWTASSP